MNCSSGTLEKAGFGKTEVIVSETGWASNGDANEVGANARNYNKNLRKRLLKKKGTPYRPKRTVKGYVFSLFNENPKPGPTVRGISDCLRPMEFLCLFAVVRLANDVPCIPMNCLSGTLEKAGFGKIEVIVSETGWASKGDANEVGANSRTYNKNLRKRLLKKKDTPYRPKRTVKGYVFSLFNENLKPVLLVRGISDCLRPMEVLCL
ncbi:glucan endo-1,3-beta-glucosidase 7-like [Impatiens glandulifera]|uniref:glucan endo-1,3-beta-glucosidase 7-like n=1 Tax=Impatiens glandulifera TaxID=253017 RepID=UPI001FB05543|nr:glucan endo-1,3-beta-glucosidase 7-like [Impatiens glandulifera]